ncbi:hypothetical protein DSM100688_0548 [Bifidobacterium ramosum]|uniref:DUF2510 domain-containing protein n=1 Tax=Bifidobacterium ramosum TaxID=1798158 RepID=A0A6L4X3Z0_9BIFI|nr:DUF2510 domain-containing protein [Bifidobacterium ramosum]KAB8289468.1 hypothetical protein DSM100688_0548 [Bifidobacterium ramosum]NEG71163.1 DUF2510 domain-containing protein [Bifidobacterium ramosum]
MAEYQPGWYPDPSGDPTRLRWWDGTQWTESVMPTSQQDPNANPNPYASQQYQAPYQQPQYANYGYAQPTYAADGTYLMTETDRNLRLAAFVLNVIGCVAWCWTIVALAWMIPMTVRSWRIYQGTSPNTTTFAVCTLIFANQIAGILLLISKKDA